MEAKGQIYGTGFPSTCIILFPWNACLALKCSFRIVGGFTGVVANPLPSYYPLLGFLVLGTGLQMLLFGMLFDMQVEKKKNERAGLAR